MHIALVYYSYSGNTHRAAMVMEEVLKGKQHAVKRLRIEAPAESRNFFIQALRGLCKRKVDILPVETDLSAYDFLLLGTPVWAREMTPAMRTYLEKVRNLEGKKVVIFVTYGSGLGREHCLDSLEKVFKEKGAELLGRFSLSQSELSQRALIENLLEQNMRL